jgi:hypothetical protein|tara:strand:- start:912 stop:1148 length:237 start_codon:yes stop_codon:yes gene_type:complete
MLGFIKKAAGFAAKNAGKVAGNLIGLPLGGAGATVAINETTAATATDSIQLDPFYGALTGFLLALINLVRQYKASHLQ